MKEGDIVTVYMDAINSQYPIGEAKLIKRTNKITEFFEEWIVEYIDNSSIHEVIIKVK